MSMVSQGRAHAPAWAWLTTARRLHPYSASQTDDDAGTIGDLARSAAERSPDTVAFVGDVEPSSYASVLTDAEALAVSLLELGVAPGEVVSFQTPNWVEAAVINVAAALAGFVVNPIVSIYRDAEVGQMLADCGARVFFHADRYRGYDFSAMVERLRPDLPRLAHAATVRGGGSTGYESLVEAGRGRTLRASKVDPDSVKMVLYTSGTTGRPKGVLHSHRTLARAVRACARHWAIAAGDTILMPSPVTHVSGYANGLEAPFLLGTRTVLMESWNVVAALDLIERHAVRGTVAATPFLQELAAEAALTGRTLPSLRFFACGGAAIAPEVVLSANAQFGRTVAFRVFGCSEAPLVTLGYPHDARRAATTDGQVIDYDVRVVGEDGRAVAPGAEGEILVRGPAMFMGYADEAQTRESLDDDGYFRTGDLGVLDPDGALNITGRKKDLIIRGGENISAKEIEDVLHRHHAVAEASVVAMPHPRLGEGVCAYVVARAGETPAFAELVAFVAASGLAPQKRPERIELVVDLPRTASGKIRKDVLRQDIRTRLAQP